MKRVIEKKYPDKKPENSNENENTPLNPAILGVPGSHGIKLPINMLSGERQQLTIKLDERRRSRIKKLEARILAKRKTIKKKVSQPLPQKAGPSSTTENIAKGDQDKDSVFARLYRNSNSAGHPKSNGNILLSSKPGLAATRNDLKPTVRNSNITALHISKTENVEPAIETQNKIVKETHLLLNNKHKEIFQDDSAKNKLMETFVETLPEKEFSFVNSHIDEIEESELIEDEKNEIWNEEIKKTVFEATDFPIELELIEIEQNEMQNEEIKAAVIENADSQKELEFVKEGRNEIQSKALEETVFETIDSYKETEETKSKETENAELTETVFEVFGAQNEIKEIDNAELTETIFETIDSQEKVEEIENTELRETVFETTDSQTELEFIEEKSNKIKDEELKNSISETVFQKEIKFIEENKNETQYEVLRETVSQISPKMEGNQDTQIENILEEKIKSVNLTSKNNPDQKPKPRIRRSISMLFHQKSRASTISRAFSDQNLYRRNKLCLNKCSRFGEQPRTSIKPEQLQQPKPKPVKSVSFATPKNNSFLSSTVLRNQLEEWLSVHGHSSEGYRHLRCFGIVDHLTPGRITKRSNAEVPKTSYTDYSLDESDKENLTPPPTTNQANEKEVENWLKELYRLITELKYPQERCEEWLTAIKNKCNSCTQMSLYWECRAALDESKGDIQSAIDNYHTAITKGKDIESGGDSLASMFDKMVLEQKTPSKSKVEKGIDPKNIFKSTVIKFALQQKNPRECGTKEEQASQAQNLVVTPVRRSSRIRTPSKNHVVSSLKSLTPEKVIFKPNMSFLE